MCGIVGAVTHTPVNQLLYDGLLLLQHRGQDAAGIVTSEGPVFHMYKGPGYVRDVFRTRNMRDLMGSAGIGHCRYPTAGSAWSDLESQPFYVNSPFGITLAHNGNLTNSEALKKELFQLDFRHVNTNSDSEVLLNVLALELERAESALKQTEAQLGVDGTTATGLPRDDEIASVRTATPLGPFGWYGFASSAHAVPAMSMCTHGSPAVNSFRNIAAVIDPAGRPPVLVMSAISLFS